MQKRWLRFAVITLPAVILRDSSILGGLILQMNSEATDGSVTDRAG
jgi:F0F1-type ATP synthase delta subunit